ncbi:NF-kappa B inhibior [Pseudocowpox virus]
MDSRRLALAVAFGGVLASMTQRRRLASVIASIGQRLMGGDGMRRVAVRLIDQLMAGHPDIDDEAFQREIRVGVGELFQALHRVVEQAHREKYFEVCGADNGAAAADAPVVEMDTAAAPPSEPQPAPLVITPQNAFMFVPADSYVRVDESVDPFFGMSPSIFGRDLPSEPPEELLSDYDPLMSQAGEPPSPRSPCEADLWCFETLGDSDSD